MHPGAGGGSTWVSWKPPASRSSSNSCSRSTSCLVSGSSYSSRRTWPSVDKCRATWPVTWSGPHIASTRRQVGALSSASSGAPGRRAGVLLRRPRPRPRAFDWHPLARAQRHRPFLGGLSVGAHAPTVISAAILTGLLTVRLGMSGSVLMGRLNRADPPRPFPVQIRRTGDGRAAPNGPRAGTPTSLTSSKLVETRDRGSACSSHARREVFHVKHPHPNTGQNNGRFVGIPVRLGKRASVGSCLIRT